MEIVRGGKALPGCGPQSSSHNTTWFLSFVVVVIIIIFIIVIIIFIIIIIIINIIIDVPETYFLKIALVLSMKGSLQSHFQC